MTHLLKCICGIAERNKMKKDYDIKTSVWEAEPLRARLIQARVLLYVHGFISDSEKVRIDKRLDKELGIKKK